MRSYSRRYPNRQDEPSPYLPILVLIGTTVVFGAGFSLVFIQKRDEKKEKAKKLRNYVLPKESSDGIRDNNLKNTNDSYTQDVMRLAKRLSIEAIEIRDASEVIDVDYYFQVRDVLQQYNQLFSSYISIYPKQKTKFIKFFISGMNHEKQEADLFSSDPSRSYGYKSYAQIVQQIQNQVESSNILILNLEAYNFIKNIPNPRLRAKMNERAYVWEGSRIKRCSDGLVRQEREDLVPISNFYPLRTSGWGRFDMCHTNMVKFFSDFNIEGVELVKLQKVSEVDFGFFKKAVYEDLRSLLVKRFNYMGSIDGYVIYQERDCSMPIFDRTKLRYPSGTYLSAPTQEKS